MATDKDILNNIPDAKPVRVFLPLKDMPERYRLQGVYHKSSPPLFSLYFKPGALPVDAIDSKDTCIINIDIGGSTVSLEAKIKEFGDSQHLVMTVVKTMSHEQMRDFFRVDAVTSVIGKSFGPQIFGEKNDDWTLIGETIDISGSGILASFPKKPPSIRQIRLKITLPTDEPEVISVLAHPVRTLKVSDKQYDVAFHFDDITSEDRDKIIGCCLVIQRKLLRLKVKVKDL